jgi:hypothetical protein
MRAFTLEGGQPLVFVLFRPTSLSRVLRFDQNGNGRVDEQEQQTMLEAMRKSPTVIGPVLTADQVRVWLDGNEHEIAQISQVPEASSNGIWQVQYLLQITPEERPLRGVWHEVRVEVETAESLSGKKVADYCEGSVGLFGR